MNDDEPPESPETEAQPPRKVRRGELETVLDEHKKWLASKGKAGKQANLSRVDLSGAILPNADLRKALFMDTHLPGASLGGADLREATLVGANLQRADLNSADLREANLAAAELQEATLVFANLGAATLHGAELQKATLYNADLRKAVLDCANLEDADLTRADLRGAMLNGAGFAGANLDRAELHDADLPNADLSQSRSLVVESLAGANLTNAKLPEEIAKFEGLKHQEEASKNARRMHFAMLLGCAYAWLTIATTTDVGLVANSASSPLPIIQTAIPIVGFYWVAPVILLSLFFYLHLYLQQLWRGHAALPSRFVDGNALDQRAYPWLLNGLIRAHLPRLREHRPAFSRLQNTVAILLAWWVVPLTLVAFWLRYLPRHEPWGTGFHLVLIVLSVLFGLYSNWLARATLRREGKPFRWRKAWREGRAWIATGTVALGVVLSAVSVGAIEGEPMWPPIGQKTKNIPSNPRTWMPWLFLSMGYRAFADLQDQAVSPRPKDWWTTEVSKRNLATVRGAKLAGRDLRYANAWGAFLVKADLDGADLRGAFLFRADLREANFFGADLRGAFLFHTDLRGVRFLTCEQLKSAKSWGKAYRDPGLACGDPNYKPPPEAGNTPD